MVRNSSFEFGNGFLRGGESRKPAWLCKQVRHSGIHIGAAIMGNGDDFGEYGGGMSFSRKPAAPAVRERRIMVALSNVVKIMTGKSGQCCWHSATKSGTSMLGMIA